MRARDDEHERWHTVVKDHTHPQLSRGAATLSALMVWAAWGVWWHVAVVVAMSAIVLVTNIYFDAVLYQRIGARAEVYRYIANNTFSMPMFWILDFALPCWFWLVFSAVTLDTTNRREAFATILLLCACDTVLAIAHGVPWQTPILFSTASVVMFTIAWARSQFIYSLHLQAQTQRDELAVAHDGLAQAHEELKTETAARERAEGELRNAQKLEALGRLAAGVAHEINTPMQFVSDNLAFIAESTKALLVISQRANDIDKAALDLDYIAETMPGALEQAQQGVQRVAAIVRSMNELAHPGGEHQPVDVNRALVNTLTISTSEYKLVADIRTDLGELPVIHANSGEVNQVLLNLIKNASDAIGDVIQTHGGRGTISVRSRRVDDHVCVEIRDTGGGIPAEIHTKIFDPFFTTKPVGRGTGQGLAISRAMVERHGGSLTFVSDLGVGTTFVIRLPISTDRAAEAAA